MYKVKFKYYQYNSGRADNGSFDGTARFKTIDEALAFKTRVENYLDKSIENTDEECEWLNDFLMSYVWSGYFLSIGDIYTMNNRLLTKEDFRDNKINSILT